MFVFLFDFVCSVNFYLKAKFNDTYASGKGGTYLKWTDLSSYKIYYKVFKAKIGDPWTQIIPYKKGMKINVLNVYPFHENCRKGYLFIGYSPKYMTYNVTYTFGKDKKEYILPKSAALKVWMEGGTINEGGIQKEFKPFGRDQETGEQLIYVTPMSVNDFEFNAANNPNFIYQYDVVVFGMWDRNAECSIKTETAQGIIAEYIRRGYGVLVGHDVISDVFYCGKPQSLLSIRDLFGIKSSFSDPKCYELNTGSSISSNYTCIYSEKILIQKEGLLTNYPHKIGLTTDELQIPITHTLQNAAAGDVWLQFQDNEYPDNCGYFPNFYLTTKDNTAMIQTGHSRGETTDDEMKIIANTIFYLKNRKWDNFLEDHSSRDLSRPIIYNINYIDKNRTLIIDFANKGTGYYFKVAAYSIVGNEFIAESDSVYSYS